MKNWIKEHGEVLAIVGTIVATTWTIKNDMHSMDVRLTGQIHDLDKRLTAIETIMIMQVSPLRALAENCEEK